jgi:hypothetical protein
MEVSGFFFFFLAQFSDVTLNNLKMDLAIIGDFFYKNFQAIEQR